MPANIQSMAYAGETPWHGLGTKVDGLMTSADAIKAGGLDWHVTKLPVQYTFNGVVKETAGMFNNVRTDTGESLGVVGKRYQPLQNKDAFRFFDALVGVKEAMYETVGALGIGEKVWLLAKLPGYVQTTKEDITEKYLLLSNSHDGSSPVQVMFTPIRVVCQNTLNVALQGKKFSVRHSLSMGTKMEEAREFLGLVNAQYTMFETLSKKLLSTPVSTKGFENYLVRSGVVPSINEGDEASTRAQNIMEEVSALFEGGKGTDLKGIRGTMWGAFNAVTEYVDHHRGGDNLAKRAQSLLYGSGAQMKQRAWEEALVLAK